MGSAAEGGPQVGSALHCASVCPLDTNAVSNVVSAVQSSSCNSTPQLQRQLQPLSSSHMLGGTSPTCQLLLAEAFLCVQAYCVSVSRCCVQARGFSRPDRCCSVLHSAAACW